MDLWRDGFSGTPGCGERFGHLLRQLHLPSLTSAAVFCACVTREEYRQARAALSGQTDHPEGG
ncbi:MAG: hypothetical protein LBJ11_02400 [Oscillospiraceae bacterium]|jgi:hypothetical protein|nr:hypothetical protein [Oscillospiraceae bacterium]